MKFTLPEDAFPDVNLSKQHQEALIAEADTIIRETIAANEEFLADGEALKDQSWRLNFAKFGFTAAGYGASCQICHRALCSKCNITKKMTVDVSGTGAVKQVALRFCLGCVREAKAKSVWEMALSGVETSSEASSTSGSARSGPLR
ncbi:hypothetical protein KRP22_006431 [Phytophthora ramorum]|nr:hypothetical protein KRP22_2438 [Phytophthora ramorum]